MQALACRPASRIVPGIKGGAPGLHRIVGSTDVMGKGTKHSLESIGPFILLDTASDMPSSSPPQSLFGVHPHCGFTAMTYVREGTTRHVSNALENERRRLERSENTIESNKSMVSIAADVERDLKRTAHARGVYVVYSGRGVVHDEIALPPGNVSLLQLWINAEPGTEAGDPTEQDVEQSNLPLVVLRNDAGPDRREPVSGPDVAGTALVLAGDFAGIGQSPAKFPGNPSGLLVINCFINAGARHVRLPVPANWEGFVLVLTGSDLRVHGLRAVDDEAAAEGVVIRQHDCCTFESSGASDGPAADIVVSNMSSTHESEFVLMAGPRRESPWVKLLGHQGGLICATEQEAHQKMKEFEEDPVNFGVIAPT